VFRKGEKVKKVGRKTQISRFFSYLERKERERESQKRED
jgi:hypothetical protein